MPIHEQSSPHADVLMTCMSGLVDETQLLHYYQEHLRKQRFRHVRAELVDCAAVTSWQIGADAQLRLATIAVQYPDQLRNLSVAMVAHQPHIYASLRMWELLREDLGYEVQVFQEMAAARIWLALPPAP
jgi:hypothetical protein